MIKRILQLSTMSVIAALIMTVTLPMVAMAEDTTKSTTSTTEQTPKTSTQQTLKDRIEAAKQQAIEQREKQQTVVKEKLDEAKQRVCKVHEQVIDSIMSRMSDRASKQLDTLNKIVERVEAFYAAKGKVLSNYNALVADVNAKRIAAEAAVAKVTSANGTFSCTGDNPRGVASGFKTDAQAKNDALKAYKTAIKNLIVGVKSVQGTTERSQQ